MQTVAEYARNHNLSVAAVYKHIRNQTPIGRTFRIIEGKWMSDHQGKPKAPYRGSPDFKIGFRVTNVELETIQALADGAGMTLAEWCRYRSLGLRKRRS